MDNITLTYDRSFEGFLSLVFDIYNKKLAPQRITTKDLGADLFSNSLVCMTDLNKADRLLNGLLAKSSKQIVQFIYHCFLSELDGIEIKLLHLIRLIFDGRVREFKNFSDPIIVDLHRVKKMVNREVHRMHAFVRFQETKDKIWACEINPDFNVLPLIGKHFKDRYPALEWIIIDVNRQYGLHYSKEDDMNFVTFVDNAKGNRITNDVISDQEVEYQSLWKQYFKSVNIEMRNNEKLHVRHVPKRYWKYLIEKQQ